MSKGAQIRLTATQAMVRRPIAPYIATPDGERPYFPGVWAIFGHGNVADLEAALATGGPGVTVLTIDTDPAMATAEGRAGWDLAVPAVSGRQQVAAAHAAYRTMTAGRQYGEQL